MHICRTGSKNVYVRSGYSDFAVYGGGHYVCAATGNLDAPDYIPQGSIRLHNTGKPNPQQSFACRDEYAGMRNPGAMHDGPETAANVSHWA